MSLINKMLQDLDKRHAADGSGKTVTQELRPVPVSKNWKRITWEVGLGLVVLLGWGAWVLYQISPRPLVTDLVFQLQGKRPQFAVRQPVAVPMVPAPAPESAPPPAPVAATAAPALPALPAANETAPGKVDVFKLATEIATPFTDRASAGRPRAERKRIDEGAPASGRADTPKRDLAVMAEAAPAHKAPGTVSIDKRVHLMTPAERADDEFRRATALLNQGRVAEAMDGYKSSLQQEAGHLAARQALVGLLLENKRIDEAQQYLQEGLNLSPDRFTYALLLARIQVERGDLQGAHDMLSKHAASAAGDAEYHAFDATLLQRLGRHKEAVAGYQAALKLAPRSGVWWMGLGISLQADGRSADALDAFRQAKSVGGLTPDLLAFIDQRMKQLQ
jgi:MSHA biogenesis protein MshN